MARTIYVPEAGKALSFPDDATDDQIITYLRGKYAPAPPPAPPEEPVGALESGFYSSLSALAAASGKGAQAVGLEGLSDYLYKKSQEESEYAAKYKPDVASISDIGGVGDVASFAGSTIAQSAPETLATIGAGALVGAAVGGPAGAVVGAVASGLASLPFFVGQNLQAQAQEQNIPLSQTSGYRASIGAVAQAPLEFAFDKLILERIPFVGKELEIAKDGFLRGVAKTAAKGAVSEGLTEGAQQAIQIAQANPQKLLDFDASVQQEILNAAAAGSLAGGVIGGGIETITAPFRPSAADEEARQRQAGVKEELKQGAERGAQIKRNAEINIGIQNLANQDAIGRLRLQKIRLDPTPENKLKSPLERFQITDYKGNKIAEFSDPVLATEAVNQYKKITKKGINLQDMTTGEEVPTVSGAEPAPKPVAPTTTPSAPTPAIQPEAKVTSGEGLRTLKTFKTALGSEYTLHADNTTTRFKTPHPGHPVTDVGLKPKSEATYFIRPEDVYGKLDVAVAEGGPGDMAITEAGPGKIGVKYINGKYAGKFIDGTIVDKFDSPEIGLSPFETWNNGRDFHFGNKITEINEPTISEPIAATPDAETEAIGRSAKTASIAGEDVARAEPSAAADIAAIGQRAAYASGPEQTIVSPAEQKAAREYLEERTNKVAEAVRTSLNKYGLKDVNTKFVPAFIDGMRIRATKGEEDRPSGKSIITLATGIYDPDLPVEEMVNRVVDTLNHETIHSLVSLGLLRENEMQMLLRAAETTLVPGKKFTYLDYAKAVYEPEARINSLYRDPNVIREEAVAEMFKDWRNKKLGPPKDVRGLINRIFDALRSMFNGMKRENYADVFQRIEGGDVGARERAAGALRGKPKKKSIEPESQDFKNWFKSSKVVDAAGAPLVVYRGMTRPIIGSAFTIREGGTYGEGIYLHKDPDIANFWADPEGTGENPVVYPVFVSIQNPASGDVASDAESRATAEKKSSIEILKGMGYDGIITEDGEIVAFDPTQVKSASGNIGTYDPNDPDIRKSIEPEFQDFKNWFKKSPVVDESGNPLIVYHGTSQYIKAFDPSKRGLSTSVPSARKAFWFSDSEENAKEFAYLASRRIGGEPQVVPVYLSLQNPLVVDASVNKVTGEREERFSEVIARAIADGHDGVIFKNATDTTRPEALRIGGKIYAIDPNGMFIADSFPSYLAGKVSEQEIQDELNEAANYFEEEASHDPDMQEYAKMWSEIRDAWAKNPKDFSIFKGPPSTVFAVFSPTQIKHARENIGLFNPNDPDIRKSIEPELPAQSFAPNYPYEQRVPEVNAAQTNRVIDNLEYGAVVNALDKLMNLKLLKTSAAKFIWPDRYRPTHDNFTSFIQNFADKMLPLGQMVDFIRKNGGTVPDALDAFMQEDLMRSTVGNMLEIREQGLYSDLLKYIKESGISYEQFEEYLYARHARERNERIREINPNSDPSVGSGMTDEEADSIIDEVNNSPQRNDFLEAEKLFRSIIKDTNNLRVESGLTPDFDMMTIEDEDGNPVKIKQYQFYAPLRGFADESATENDVDEDIRARVGQGLKIRGREDMRAFGRRSKASDIIAHAILQNSEAVVRSQKNKVGNSLLGLIEENPELAKDFGAYVMTKGKKPLKKYISSQGVVKSMVDPMYKNSDDVLVVKRNGEEIPIKIDNVFLQKALLSKKTGSPDIAEKALNFMQKGNRILGAVNTALNPEFMLVNFPRDLQTALVSISQYEIDNIKKKVFKDSLGAVMSVYKILRDPKTENAWSDWYRMFKEDGGNTNGFFGVAFTLQERIDKIQKMVQDTSGSPVGRTKDAVQFLGDFLNDMNGSFENAIRLSVYKNVVEALGVENRQKAAQIAKNLTINFDKRGLYGPFLNSLYLFYNASVQGTMALATAMARSKKVRRTVAGVVVMGAVQDILNSMMSEEDDDGRKIYDKIPDYVLQGNIVIMDPFGISNKGYIHFPLPYGLNAFFNMGRAMSRNLRGEYKTGDAISSIGSTFVDAFNPVGGTESLLNFIAPTALDPVVALTINQDYSGRRIYPEPFPGSVPKADSQLYWTSTSPFFKNTADWLNSLSGGTEYVPGMIDWNPAVMEYIYDYATGGLGAFVRRTYDTATSTIPSALSGDLTEVEVNSIPVFRKLLGNVSERVTFEDYFNKVNHVLARGEELKSAIREGDPQRIRDVRARFADELKIYPTVRALANKRNQLAAELRKVRENEKIPPETRRRRIELIQKQIETITQRVNKLYEQGINNKYPGLFS